jgi:hypothetical protein
LYNKDINTVQRIAFIMIINKEKKFNHNDKIPFLTLTLLDDRAILKHIKREINQNQDEKENPRPRLTGKTSKYQKKT